MALTYEDVDFDNRTIQLISRISVSKGKDMDLRPRHRKVIHEVTIPSFLALQEIKKVLQCTLWDYSKRKNVSDIQALIWNMRLLEGLRSGCKNVSRLHKFKGILMHQYWWKWDFNR